MRSKSEDKTTSRPALHVLLFPTSHPGRMAHHSISRSAFETQSYKHVERARFTNRATQQGIGIRQRASGFSEKVEGILQVAGDIWGRDRATEGRRRSRIECGEGALLCCNRSFTAGGQRREKTNDETSVGECRNFQDKDNR